MSLIRDGTFYDSFAIWPRLALDLLISQLNNGGGVIVNRRGTPADSLPIS